MASIRGMRIGITSDLHYGMSPKISRAIKRFVEQTVAPAELDLLVIAGDVAESQLLDGPRIGCRHVEMLEHLRAAVAMPVAFCAGNHDIWSTDPETDSWQIYRTRLAEIAEDVGATYLEESNLALPELTVVGCYGHFDFSLRIPDLVIAGEVVTQSHYLRQTPPGHDEPVWMDGRRIRWDRSDEAACAQICARAARRMEHALDRGKPILFVSHTVPRQEVNGHFGSDSEVSLFLNAFSGTSRLERVIRMAVERDIPVTAVSGHTHKRVPLGMIDGVGYLNAGGEYGRPHLEILEWPGAGDVVANGPGTGLAGDPAGGTGTGDGYGATGA